MMGARMSAPSCRENKFHDLVLDALISGYPRKVRDSRLYWMWQAFIDDSRSWEGERLLVLGGFVATIPQWKAFNDEWQQMLDMKPSIKYFKMNEAAKARGQFLYWSEERITERVQRAYKVIEEIGIPLQASVIIRLDAFYEIFTEEYWEKNAINPYYLAHGEIIRNFAHHQIKFGVDAPVDFIFDEQVMEQEKIRNAWGRIKAEADPAIRHLLGNKPEFRDDEQVLPLQAADLLAWWVERWRPRNTAQTPRPLNFRGNQPDLSLESSVILIGKDLKKPTLS